jgi:hypothetical protein
MEVLSGKGTCLVDPGRGGLNLLSKSAYSCRSRNGLMGSMGLNLFCWLRG